VNQVLESRAVARQELPSCQRRHTRVSTTSVFSELHLTTAAPHCLCPCCFVLVLLPCSQAIQRGALHLAATVHLGLQSDPYFTTQNQVEVFSTGTLQRARLPLEATIRISPTLQLTNGLPYDVLGWAIAPPHKEFASTASTAAGGPGAASAAAAAAQAKAAAASDGGSDLRTGSAAAMAASMLSEDSETGRPGGSRGCARAAGEGRGSIELTAPPAGAGAGRLAGLQQVWAAGNKKEAELALARLVAGEHCCHFCMFGQHAAGQALGRSSCWPPALKTCTVQLASARPTCTHTNEKGCPADDCVLVLLALPCT
jgi:hypothetical protein